MKRKEISIVKVCFFTEKAECLFNRIKTSLPEILWIPIEDRKELSLWTEDAFKKSIPLLFISAAGIAVRTISPFVKDKFTDSPVLVMDENGKFVIPVLSGHIGNSNAIANMISKAIDAQSVITTGTDVNEKFSIDDFAKINGFRIVNRDGIKRISSRILSGEQIKIFFEKSILMNDTNIPDEIIRTDDIKTADVVIASDEANVGKNSAAINLVAKKYCLGMGCKKGKTFEELKDFAEKVIKENLNCELKKEICSLSSIDLKEKETGLLEFSHYLHVPFISYTAEELMNAKGCFSESEFVMHVTGVSNVCERSASLSAGDNGKIILHKFSDNGMTVSVAEKNPEIVTWSKSIRRII